MRNLKRALSLTLASVMLLGMMVVGSSAAAGYDDVKETDNVEAIEVLQTVGVMVGDERGFGPDRPVNRAEMAVVMGLLLNLDYNYYSATCPFNDVYDWARGWVGACAANGIVSGRGDGVYDPGATVTAVEGASMLMRALGYFKYASDYADGFEVSTVRQGTTIGIFDGVGSSATEPMTRNQVAQMVLNTLKSGMVQPDGNTLNYFDNNGNIIATGGKINYVYVTSNKAFARSISSVAATSMGSTNDAPIVELGEQLYNGELKLYDKQVDDFNRPSRIWEYQGNEIGTYVKKELLKQEYTVKVTGQTLYELLTKNTIDTYRFEIAVDGVQYDDAKGAAVLKDAGSYFDKTDLYRTNKDGVGGTGKGVLTQVFVDTDYTDPSLYTVYISVINTYLAKANEDYDAKDDDVRLDVFAIADDVQTRVYAKKNPNNTDDIVETITVDGDEFDIKDVKEDDLFLVTVADSAIQTMVAPEIVSDTVINAFSQRDWINLSGTQYDYASTARYDVDVLYLYDNPNLKDVTYNVILDKYGYAIGLELNEDPDQYVFLTGIEQGYSNLATRMVDANVIHMDGTMKTVKVDTKESALPTFPEPSQANTWCVYRVDSNDVYTLDQVSETTVPRGTDKAYQWKTDKVDGSEETTIDQKHISLPSYATTGGVKDYAGTAQSVTYGDDKTVYLNVELDNIPAKDFQGNNRSRRIIDDVTSVVTGHRNVKISVKNCEDAVENSITYKAPAEEIYTLYNDKNYIIAVVTIGEDEGISSNWAYVTSSEVKSEAYNGNTTRADNDGKWTWSREVIIDGKKTEIKYVGETLDYIGVSYGKNRMYQGQWYEIKFDADGNVRRAEALATKLNDEDLTDGFINDIKDAREAVTKKDNVLLWDTALPAAIKFDEQGTLYTEDDITKGFAVSPDVKVVLALGSKLKSDKTVAPFDTVDDCEVYSGYTGLRNALKDMNVKYEKAGWENKWSEVELDAILVNNSATVIVIRDDNAAPDNKPTDGSGSDQTTGDITAASSVAIKPNGTSYGTLEINKFTNKATLSIKFKAPGEWAEVNEAAGDVTIKYVVKVNGDKLGEYTSTATAPDTDKVYTVTGNVTDLNNALGAKTITSNDKITVEITSATWKYAGVKYVYADGTTAIENGTGKQISGDETGGKAPTKLKIGSDNAEGFKFVFDADKAIADGYTVSSAKYAITGATKAADETETTDGDIESTGSTTVTFTAGDKTGLYAGNGWVTVKITGVTKTVTPPTETKHSVREAVADNLVFSTTLNGTYTATLSDVEKDTIVYVKAIEKATGDGALLTGGLTFKDNDTLGAITPTVTATAVAGQSGVYQFTMPNVNVVVDGATVTYCKVLDGSINSTLTKVNLKIGASDTAPSGDALLKLAKDYINANAAKLGVDSATIKSTSASGVVTSKLYITKNGIEDTTGLASSDITVSKAARAVTVEYKNTTYHVLTDGTANGLDDVLAWVGISSTDVVTPDAPSTSEKPYFLLKPKTGNEVTGKAYDSTDDVTDGDTVMTNWNGTKYAGYVKVAVTDGTTANNIIGSGKLFTAGTTYTVKLEVPGAIKGVTNTQYVPADMAECTWTVTVAIDADQTPAQIAGDNKHLTAVIAETSASSTVTKESDTEDWVTAAANTTVVSQTEWAKNSPLTFHVKVKDLVKADAGITITLDQEA